MRDLTPLPLQPADVPWPTQRWPEGDRRPDGLATLADEIFGLPETQSVSYALLVIHRGRLVYERYAAGANRGYLQYSWSMAKSVTHALVGILVGQGRLDITAPAPVPEWQGDARAEITLDQLLRMSSGLEFAEDYYDGGASDVIPMLFGEGRFDTGTYAADKPLAHPPDSVWSYSSGTTNIICRILRDVIGNGPSGMLDFMHEELFDPLGMRTPTPRFDRSGTFVGSSFLLATPQDFARFGLWYLRDGFWEGRQRLPEGWVDYARTPTHLDSANGYGAHFWIDPDNPERFYCSGYDGQRILMAPTQDLVIVRCGRTPEGHAPAVFDRVNAIVDLGW